MGLYGFGPMWQLRLAGRCGLRLTAKCENITTEEETNSAYMPQFSPSRLVYEWFLRDQTRGGLRDHGRSSIIGNQSLEAQAGIPCGAKKTRGL